jgi:hypothetical protein
VRIVLGLDFLLAVTKNVGAGAFLIDVQLPTLDALGGQGFVAIFRQGFALVRNSAYPIGKTGVSGSQPLDIRDGKWA